MRKNIKFPKEKIIKILKRHGVKKAGIFGSYARGEANKNSDIDILVEFNKIISLFDLTGIKLELEEKLKKKVDLVTYSSINRHLKKYILADEVQIM